jgi:ATP-dependent DNA ligase
MIVIATGVIDQFHEEHRAAEKRGLEGVVSKRRDAPYRSGDCRDWRKVKTDAWREANRERWRLFA